MTDILFGNNNRPVLKLLAKRSLKAQKKYDCGIGNHACYVAFYQFVYDCH